MSGVTTRSGNQIDLAVTGVTIRSDTLRANAMHDSVAIPVDSVAQVSVRGFSARNTAGLAVGLGAAGLLALILFSLSNLGSIQ
ncbi:MAG: hypothetical protein ABI884_03750 [Gemmatimonadota bacterium]